MINNENRKGNTKLKLILGQAGSGKSTKLLQMIQNGEIERPIILCSKWLLVNRMKERVAEYGLNCRVVTIQSITQRVDNAKNVLYGVDTIILDEFSQIDYLQLLALIDSAEKLGITNIVAAGDFLQNEPINGGSYSPLRHIVRQFLLGKESNFFASLIKTDVYDKMYFDDSYNIEVPEALSSLFNEIEYDILLDNHRQGDNVTIRSYYDILNLLNKNIYDCNNTSLMIKKLKKALESEDWQILVADWKQMELVNIYAENNGIEPSNNSYQYYIDSRGIDQPAYRKYYTKIDEKYEIINGSSKERISVKDLMYIVPTYAIVADSAQGLEFENVLLFSMLDDSTKNKTKFYSWSNFSFNSLYMAATRHKNVVDLCIDKNGWKDIKNALEILPNATKQNLKDEWYQFCLQKAPNAKIGYESYTKREYFNEVDGELYSILGKNDINIHGTLIQFAHDAKKEIELYSEATFMKDWINIRGQDEYASKIMKKYFGKNTKENKKKASKAEQFLIDFEEDNIDFDLSVRKFKEKYNIDKRQVVKALETYKNWI